MLKRTGPNARAGPHRSCRRKSTTVYPSGSASFGQPHPSPAHSPASTSLMCRQSGHLQRSQPSHEIAYWSLKRLQSRHLHIVLVSPHFAHSSTSTSLIFWQREHFQRPQPSHVLLAFLFHHPLPHTHCHIPSLVSAASVASDILGSLPHRAFSCPVQHQTISKQSIFFKSIAIFITKKPPGAVSHFSNFFLSNTLVC